MTDTEKIQRYEPICRERSDGVFQSQIVPDDCGCCVLHADHLARVQQLEAQLAALSKLIVILLEDNRVRGYIHPSFAAKLEASINAPKGSPHVR